MTRLHRRSFLGLASGSLVSLATLPFAPLRRALSLNPNKQDYLLKNPTSCWLDVCGSLVVEDDSLGIHSEIILTSDTFVGAKGFEDGADTTEYEIYLYDSLGRPAGTVGTVAKRLVVPSMQTTVLKVSDLIGSTKTFWGGLKVRLRPKGREPMHASDLFSSAFVRWKTAESFDNVHANPDPLEWQRPDSFFYSMPFPPLDKYECTFGVFNPYEKRSVGAITLYDPLGSPIEEIEYKLEPYSSLLLDLRKGTLTSDAGPAFWATPKNKNIVTPKKSKEKGGTIAVTNQSGSVKNFAYLIIRADGANRFSVEHPIHQPPFNPAPPTSPVDADGRFKAKNILYTPLVFRSKQIGGLTLNSRYHFSSGAPMERFLWLNPLVTNASGNVVWQSGAETQFPSGIPSQQIERGLLKLGGCQSCIFDCSELSLPDDFSGGLSLAVAPNTNHTLMKVEISVLPWGAHAFTHFRPGLRSARSYQLPKSRGGLSTDYIATGGRVEHKGSTVVRDEIIAILNIDDKNVVGRPTLEIFGAQGLLQRIKLNGVAEFGCRHFLLSEFLSEEAEAQDLSLRLICEEATLLMSIIHLDYGRRDIALDHGSDRFSTLGDYGCNVGD